MKKNPARLVRRLTNSFLPMTLFLLLNLSVRATNGTWINSSSGGLWSSAANWAGSIANGNGATANFASIDITLDNTVHLDSARTLTALVFGDTATVSAAGWILDNNGSAGNTLTLTNGLITVNSLGGTKTATISVILVGTNSLAKSGPGILVLSSSNTYSGNTIISNGVLTLNGSGAISSSPSISVVSGATLNVLAAGYTVGAGQVLTGAGSVLNGTVSVTSGGTLSPGDAGVCGTLTLSGLNLSSGATNNFEFSATGTNDLVNTSSLTLNGGVINLYQAGTATPFAQAGTYNLIHYNGGVGGVGVIALTVGNPQPGFTYSFANTGTFITVTLNALPVSTVSKMSVHSLDGTIIAVHFEDFVQLASATNTTNYVIFGKGASGAINVTNAILLSDEQTVALYLDSSAGEFFAVGVSNVLDFSNSNIIAQATGYLGDLVSTNIGVQGDPDPAGEVISIFNDFFQVTASGSDIGGTNDHCRFIYQPVLGNFDMAAQITRLDNADPQSKAGLMLRETIAPGSRMVQTCLTPQLGTNQIQLSARLTTNGNAFSFGTPVSSNTFSWLRITRANNIITTFYGTNGVNWTQSGQVFQSLSNLLLVGMAVTSHNNGHTTTASLNSFGVAGARPGDGIVPTLSVSVFQKTNLIAKWLRTPRDFTVQVCSNLFFTNATSGSINETNATQWAFLGIPVFDTALTGTNAAMPTPGRYMTIPMNLYSNNQIYVRLAQVDRVIPDPLGVTAGTIFSQASGNMNTTTSGSTICGTAVDTTTAVAQVGVPILCPAGKSYQFTTADSSSALKTVIQVRNYPTIGISNCDSSFSAGSFKSQVTLTQTNTSCLAGYTFVAAVTSTSAKPTVTCPIKVKVNF